MSTHRWIGSAIAGLIAALGACASEPQGPEFPVPGVTGRLAYTVAFTREPPYTQYELRVMDLETGSTRTIYTTEKFEFISAITWHPSGHSLVIAVTSGNPVQEPVIHRLRKLNDDGTGLTPVYDVEGPEIDAAYSPQGALAYCAQRTILGVEGLYIDGTLTWPGYCDWTSPSWFPDGSAVVVVGGGTGGYGLHRVERATKTASLILPRSSTGLYDPAVSPLGDLIAVSVTVDSGLEVWLLRLDGSIAAVLPGGWEVNWSPDAARIMYVWGTKVYVRELATGNVDEILDGEVYVIAWLP